MTYSRIHQERRPIAIASDSLPLRLLQYLQERFPPVAYSLMTAIFVLAGITLSSTLRLGYAALTGTQFLTGFVVVFALFFQLRVADEWKDREEDSLYQSDRPVPRGLITLRELTWVAAATALVQVALVSAYDVSMLALLAVVWTYFFLMSKEFFCPRFLRARPALYVISHMFILVLSDLFITALDWWHSALKSVAASSGSLQLSATHMSHGLVFFLLAAFANGLVIELGRKIRNTDEERPGVETYSKMLGLVPALYLLIACLISAHIFIACALFHLAAGPFVVAVLALMDMLMVLIACHATREHMQKPITNLSNLTVLISYAVVFFSALCS